MSTISSENQQALDEFWNWMEETDRARIVFIKAPGRDFYNMFNKDTNGFGTTSLIWTMHEKIQAYQDVDPDKREWFINESMPKHWSMEYDEELYKCYQLFKLLWLTNDINQNGLKMPIQLYKNGREYHCHPGSDKKLSICYIDPLPKIQAFYIWYPELDATPWHWGTNYEEVTDQKALLNWFAHRYEPTFKLNTDWGTFTRDGYEITDDHIRPWAGGAWRACQKYGKFRSEKTKIELPHLSYKDAVHRMKMDHTRELMKEMYFVNDTHFQFGRYDFYKPREMWTISRLLDSKPASIIDNEAYIKGKSENHDIVFSGRETNISRERLFQ